jgi:hypothetical protein
MSSLSTNQKCHQNWPNNDAQIIAFNHRKEVGNAMRVV